MKKIYHSKYNKIFIERLDETTYISVYNKYGCWFSAISENNKSNELKEDIDDALKYLHAASARKWLKNNCI